MADCEVYLELGPGGECMAHVLTLPGCIAKGNNQDEALTALPGAIHSYHAWLRQHGEKVADPAEPIEFRIAEISTGFGPFRPGDKAALFSPDRMPVSREEMEQIYLCRSAYARADLMAIISDLPEKVLRCKPDRETSNIRQILRHIGNAEEWYISRIVDPETLPPEWAHDKKMPIFDFLEMERRTALDRLHRLTDRELSEVFYPTLWTKYRGEPWTARKVLRRFLEHEREHTVQIKEILARWQARSGTDMQRNPTRHNQHCQARRKGEP